MVGMEKTKHLSEAQNISNASRVQLSGVTRSLDSHFPIFVGSTSYLIIPYSQVYKVVRSGYELQKIKIRNNEFIKDL